MARTAAGDRIVVRPANNVYTVLVAIALVVEIVGFIALTTRHTEIFGQGFFSSGPAAGR